MEYLEGNTLQELLRSQGSLSLDETRAFVDQAARALEAIHARGFVHRDVKPDNFMDGGGGGARRWKLVDFGAAVAVGTRPTPGTVVGTPAYISPEQARGGPAEPRADVCSLALVAYRCLTGQPAFSGADPAAVLLAARCAMPPRPSVPEEVELVLALGVARDPAHRFASATELADAFAAAAAARLRPALRRRALAVLSETPWGSFRLSGEAPLGG
jgi:serine/threonine-protein kinase